MNVTQQFDCIMLSIKLCPLRGYSVLISLALDTATCLWLNCLEALLDPPFTTLQPVPEGTT